MKSLLLIRHAKSSWDLDVDDFDRPLNHRGKHDAPSMAKRLKKKEIKIDGFISSPAKRALATAVFFAEEYDMKLKDIITVPTLYEPTIEAFYNAIEDLDDNFKTVAIFSHNPAITNFANQLTSFTIDDMPTCAVFAVKGDGKKWKEFISAEKKFWFFDYPKAE
ncbi:SixA phosphatase family protein [Segetibacter koreensis]|uniref:SixA phosphatase family protein n=1 Tax=Segetibacter koreensis TaxID=398037 RepID=UPI000374E5EE|nr:histidine phosphatase family protein [Segetibacter koreensis]